MLLYKNHVWCCAFFEIGGVRAARERVGVLVSIHPSVLWLRLYGNYLLN